MNCQPFDPETVEATRKPILDAQRRLVRVDGQWSFKTRKGLKAAIRFATQQDAQSYVNLLHTYYAALNNSTQLIVFRS
jgi:hypothetical protein